MIAGGDEKDLTGVIQQIADYKTNVYSFIGSSTTVEEQIKSGDIWMYVDIGGVVESAKALRNLPVEFVVPAEGSPVSINTLVLPAGNPRSGCAKAFVSFLLGEGQQRLEGSGEARKDPVAHARCHQHRAHQLGHHCRQGAGHARCLEPQGHELI